MELPKLNYDDFYKFSTSFGIILIVLSLITPIISLSYFYKTLESAIINSPEQLAKQGYNNDTITKLISLDNVKTTNSSNLFRYALLYCWLFLISGFSLLALGLIKWYGNQKIKDRILREKFRLIRETTTETLPSKKDKKDTQNKKIESPQIEYKIDSALQGTVNLNLLKDKRIWFMVQNNEDKKYLVYFIISLYFNNNKTYTYDNESYYGGNKEWNLNPRMVIKSPGLTIPDDILDKVKNTKDEFRIKIDCEIKDEKGKLIEKRLPMSYVYVREDNSWYFAP
jgi:hypothetical protein